MKHGYFKEQRIERFYDFICFIKKYTNKTYMQIKGNKVHEALWKAKCHINEKHYIITL